MSGGADDDPDIDLLGERSDTGDEDTSDGGADGPSDTSVDGVGGEDHASEEGDASGASRQRVNEPLGDLAQRINEEDRAALEATEDVFEEADIGEIDVDTVWEELEAGAGPTGEAVDDEEHVRRISKSICHNCPHFGDPPELACTHEGTTIREMPDNEHFVVVECPVVEDGITEDPR